MYQLVLASASPRRRQLLKEAGFSCLVHPSQVSEKLGKNMTIDEQLLELAGRKARTVFDQFKSVHLDPFIVLAADTEVIFNGSPLGKPENETQIVAFLKLLSGTTHSVKTALIFMNSSTGETVSHLETTDILFKDLSDRDIIDYAATRDGLDKAGGYGIQGEASKFVKSINGSWTNVVGLPIEVVIKIFEQRKWKINP